MDNKEDLSQTDIKAQVMKGIKWLAFCKFIGQLLNWCMTLVVIRLVSPSDYGLMAMAMAFIGLVALVNEMGIGASIVQAESFNEGVLPNLFGFILSVNIILFSLSLCLAPPISSYYGSETLAPLIKLLSLQFLVGSFCVMPKSLLERKLNFKVTASVDFIANIISGIVALILAFWGYGVWALAWSALCMQVLRALFLNIASPFRHLPRFDFSALRGFVKFGGILSAERLLWYLYTQADIFIIGKLLGADLVGIYSVAKHLSSLPMQKISPLINQITLPAFSRFQNDKVWVAQVFLKGIRLMGLVGFPVFLGMASVSDDLILVVLGSKWKDASLVLTLLCLIMPLGLMNGFMSTVTKAVGRVEITFGNMFFAILIMPISILFGSHWGINGVAWAWLICYPIIFIYSLIRCSPYLNVTLKQIILEIKWTAFISITMLCLLKLAKNYFGIWVNEEFTLVSLVLVGIVYYSSSMYLFSKKNLVEIIGLVRH